jgi:outer membrane protein assembly factor BamB
MDKLLEFMADVSPKRTRYICILTTLLLSTASAHAQEWTRFRGPNGSGTSETIIPAKWTPDSYRWKVELPGTGHGSPVLWSGKVFLNASRDEGRKRLVTAIDATTGKTLWTTPFESSKHKTHKHNSFATSTPTVDAGHVFSVWGHKGELRVVALDHDGKTAWDRDLGGVNGGHGFGVSPILHDDLLILPNDQEKGGGYIIALDKQTGKTRWKIPRKSKRLTFSTPCIYSHPGGGQADQLILTNWWLGITSLNPGTGKLNWEKSVFGRPHAERAIASPIVTHGLVIGTCGFTTLDKHLVAMDPLKGEEVWRIEQSVPHIPCPIVVNDLLFMWGDGGILSCLDPRNGKTHWRERVKDVRDTYFGSPVAAGNHIFCTSSNGSVVVIEASKTFRQLAVNELEELCRSTPAIANGNLYLRTYGHLYCIKGE